MKWKVILAVPAVAALALWAGNTSLFSRFPEDEPLRLIAHRGQHQLFDRTDLASDTCTANRMLPPTHGFLENTIPSMRAAFDAGADVVELDVHLTPDKQFAVFHDWTLDCRTNGTGVTEETPMTDLKALDIGYGYTADGGATFPFRGQGVGLMPTLPEVFRALPEGRFLVNFKSRRTEEGEALAAMLSAEPAFRQAVFGVYGGGEPTERTVALVENMPGFSNRSAKSCLVNYLALGWSGHVPEDCRNTLVAVPANYAFLLWGWPERFYARMQAAGSDVILMGPYEAGDAGTSGIDDAESWNLVPAGFPGLVWTNRIEAARPEVERRGFCSRAAAPAICRR
ncbi:glycerophosphodiester phosphodiesterase family protein [Rhizobium sp. LCM 4573]|uniref:glycerophosphodiester phosphodiesterase family protein n=1 Tax=Rhizobium sp. LCM 4573 TaxID=1848291 RepID=UPI0008DB02E5|nr:glycerophosphodiester phosphodiesterase family protein [Rhizobium sp. LCM 4573]OHV76706.1 glycerophosphodiester phosphodiesterase [Rhizobium sp. LCM 4573]